MESSRDEIKDSLGKKEDVVGGYFWGSSQNYLR
jgi:hypothetical protein